MFGSILRFAGCSAVLAACFCAPASAATTTLQISGVFQEQVGPSARCPSNFGGQIVGYGASALLGKLVFIASDCITPMGSYYSFSNGRFIVTTLTGEQIYASYSGQFISGGQGTTYVFNGATFQITGGTGRYVHASGGGTLAGSEDMATGSGSLTLTGRILYQRGD
jgi:hypothetical protein